MKKIYNYKKATVFDLETDGLIDTVSKIYICGYKMYNQDKVNIFWGDKQENRIRAMLQWHIDNKIPMVCHNGITYDIPVLEKVYNIDLSELMVIDTLALSWYLNIDKKKHSLEALSFDYSVSDKFQVDQGDWVNLTKEQAISRVTADVDINVAVYNDFIGRLEDMYSLAKEQIDSGNVGGKRTSDDEVIYLDRFIGDSVEEHVNRILTFLMAKKDAQALQEKTGWDVDVDYLKENIDRLEKLVEESAKNLESVMPPMPEYKDRPEPKLKFKKNGELSKSGENWERLKKGLSNKEVDDWGNKLFLVRKEGYITELTGYKQPNINGHQQVKDFLFSHGWKPKTFKYVRDEEAFDLWVNNKPRQGAQHWEWSSWKDSKPEDRGIPQIRVEGGDGKELCESVSELAETVPEIKYLEEYSVMKHRLDTMKGILSRVDSKGKVYATCHGYTNTLRLKHMAPIVNLPGANKKYAEPIRGCLIAKDGYISCGSDLSALEDRVKHHFMIPHDPNYVNTMMDPDFDPHILMALSSGMITEKEFNDFKNGIKPLHVTQARAAGKTTNYACVYSAGPKTIAEGAGVSLEEGEKLHKGYWELNWSVKAIAEEQVVITDKLGLKWLVNPINGHCYSVRSEKDYFSTLAQGTGSYFFDMWVDKIITKQKNLWGKCTLTASMHDEIVLVVKDNNRIKNLFDKIIRDSIKEVSEEFMVRRELGCDVQFNKRYSEIH